MDNKEKKNGTPASRSGCCEEKEKVEKSCCECPPACCAKIKDFVGKLFILGGLFLLLRKIFSARK
ncbi:hypothetical protein ACFL35_00735 [Candidatus Riflebacteria bacterium]